MMRIRATTVAFGERAVALTGPSGAGKSDLALRLIDRGAVLVSDDYTEIDVRDGRPFARPPAAIAGKLEVRGLGLVDLPYRADVAVVLAADLDPALARARMPAPRATDIGGCRVASLVLDAFTAAAPVKLEWALARAPKPGAGP